MIYRTPPTIRRAVSDLVLAVLSKAAYAVETETRRPPTCESIDVVEMGLVPVIGPIVIHAYDLATRLLG